MIQALKLFGYLPNFLELSMNPCVQGCHYCYAKIWKREDIPIEKVINDILRKETKPEGLVPFLIRKRSPITISNRTDVMCAPDWRERISALKKLGFPLYIETKLNKDYKDLAQILDKNTDCIYQTITGFNNKYEEPNILTAQEKLDAAKWFNEQGFFHELAVNPFMPDKCSVEDVKKMIDYVKPKGFVMRDYHTSSKVIMRKNFPPEYPKDVMENARAEIRAYCKGKNVFHAIEGFESAPYPELNLISETNRVIWGGNSFVFIDLLISAVQKMEENGNDAIQIRYKRFCDFYEKQFKYFEGCIFKKSDYTPSTGRTGINWKYDRFDIYEFTRSLWNWGKINVFDSFSDKKDEDGNIIYFRDKRGFWKDIERREGKA